MNEILKYYLKSLSSSTQSLKKKSILVEKPWALLDNDGEIQKLIFKKDGGLILSKNGRVTEGSWEYFAEARALLINRSIDKLLLSEQFIDDNVLIFKKDGTDNDFYAFANELTLPDHNIAKYLNSIKCIQFNIKQMRLLSGHSIQIYSATQKELGSWMTGNPVELIDNNYRTLEIPDGKYLTSNRNLVLYIKGQRLANVWQTAIAKLADDSTLEIESGDQGNYKNNVGKIVTINGKPVEDKRIKDKAGVIFVIRESRIMRILFHVSYEIGNDGRITIEQNDHNKIRRGDKIVESTPTFPLPNGKFKIKGRFSKIHVVNNQIT